MSPPPHWRALSPEEAAALAPRWQPLLVAPEGEVAPARFEAREYAFLPDSLLVRARYPEGHEGFGVFAIVSRQTIYPLDGDSVPLHMARRHEAFALTDDTVVEYLRFFCQFTHGEEGPFRLVEAPSDLNVTAEPQGEGEQETDELSVPYSALDAEGLTARLVPPALLPGDLEKGWKVRAIVQYGAGLFRATFRVSPAGDCTMEDDDALVTDLPFDPGKNRVPKTRNAAASSASEPEAEADETTGPLPSSEYRVEGWIVRTLTELRLVQALREGAGAPVLEARGDESDDELLQRFSRWVAESAPLIVLECELPFCEELLLDVLSEKGPVTHERHIGKLAGGPGTDVHVGRLKGNGTVLLSLHEARGVAAPEELAHRLTVHPLAVLIGTPERGAIPPALQRVADLTLALPRLDATGFRKAFCRLLDCDWPGESDAELARWVAYVEPQDFFRVVRGRVAHRRTNAGSIKPESSWSTRLALAHLRDRVRHRLSELDPGSGPELKEIHGLGEARVIAEDLIHDIRAAVDGRLAWNEVDRGLLIVGEPGTGKTMLARAVAKACGVRFLARSAASWIAGTDHLGQHLAAIRATFGEARRLSPCILFLDEIDSLGNRASFAGRNRAYDTQIVNAVLQELQGFDERGLVFVVAATNHEAQVDPALRRPGRLDQVVRVPRPNRRALEAIFRHYLKRYADRLDDDHDLHEVAALALGFTGADVERFVRGAARRARKEDARLAQRHLLAEVSQLPRQDDLTQRLSPEVLERTAVHEAGHALALLLSRDLGSELTMVSILPRPSGSLGFTGSARPERAATTLRGYREQLQVLMAGRAAEALVYGENQVSSGAGGPETSDLAKATGLAVAMVLRRGMGRRRRLRWSPDARGDKDVDAVRELLRDAYRDVKGKLERQLSLLHDLRTLLVERQEVSAGEIEELARKRGLAVPLSQSQGVGS